MTHVIVRTESQMKRAVGETRAQYFVPNKERNDLIFALLMARENVAIVGAPGSKSDVVVITINDGRLKS